MIISSLGPSIHVIALALQRQTRIKRQESEEEVQATNEQLERMLAQQQRTKEELERTKRAHTALEDKMESENLRAQQTSEEIQRRSKAIESNVQEMNTIHREGQQRRIAMKKVSAGSGILSTLGTVSAVAVAVFCPPAGLVAAGTINCHSHHNLSQAVGFDTINLTLRY